MTIIRRVQTGFELASWSHETDGVVVKAPNPYYSTTTVKTGTYSMRSPSSDNGGTFYWTVPSTYQLRVGFHFRIDYTAVESTKSRFCTFRSGTPTDLAILFYKRSAGSIHLTVAGVEQDVNIGVLGLSTWVHIGIDIKIDGSSGWIKVYLDGTEILSYTGNTGTLQMESVTLGDQSWSGYCTNETFFDDLYINDATGEGAATVVPDRRFPLISPDGNGNYSQMTGSDGDQTDNYLLVDEIPPNGDTDFVRAGAPSLNDSYAMADYTKPANADIIAVIPIAVVQKESVDDIKLAVGTRLSATDLIGSAQELPTSYGLAKWERQTTKPGGGAWTEADVDGAELVLESGGTYT